MLHEHQSRTKEIGRYAVIILENSLKKAKCSTERKGEHENNENLHLYIFAGDVHLADIESVSLIQDLITG